MKNHVMENEEFEKLNRKFKAKRVGTLTTAEAIVEFIRDSEKEYVMLIEFKDTIIKCSMKDITEVSLVKDDLIQTGYTIKNAKKMLELELPEPKMIINTIESLTNQAEESSGMA